MSRTDERLCLLVSYLLVTCLLDGAVYLHVAVVVFSAVCCEISCGVRSHEAQAILRRIGTRAQLGDRESVVSSMLFLPLEIKV